MMPLQQLFVLALVPLMTSAVVIRHNSTLDINQKVYIEGMLTLGDAAGEGALNQCKGFAAQHVSNAGAPEVKVCGTGIKTTVFLRGRCEEYYTHQVVVGKCDTGMPSDTCDSFSPDIEATFGAYQSYKIEQC
mmetsp:Transcript_115095/g.215426  ORF Transcript_115095/g.215426 Transcript_115095/m.215426 type:complete len:132 (-) Transcript_115095:62-457(-)